MKYIFRNAYRSIIRNKSRNILMLIIIIVIACAGAITLSIRNAANTLVAAYENKYNIEASLAFNRAKIMENFKGGEDAAEENIEKFNSLESISVQEINTYGTSDYVDYYYYTYSIGVNSSDIEQATEQIAKVTTETKTTTTPKMPPEGFFGGKSGSTTRTTRKTEIIGNLGIGGDFTLVGYSSYEGMNDFVNGSYSIISGEVNSDFTANTCVINSELASLNELEIGDTITLENVNDKNITIELSIVGIFEDNSEESSDMRQMYSNSVNKIITNINMVEQIADNDEETKMTITPTFVLKSKDVVDKFSDEVLKKGLNENYQVTTNLEEITSETASITNVSKFATTFLIITLIIGAVVLFILNMINVRERKYEIGVLRTIGMKKNIVTFQFMFELLAITMIGMLLGASIGATSSVKIANKMLENEISAAAEEQNKIRSNFGRSEDLEENDDAKKLNGVVKISEVTNINAVVDFKVLFELLAIGLGLTLFSSMSSMISISRFSPLTILKERS